MGNVNSGRVQGGYIYCKFKTVQGGAGTNFRENGTPARTFSTVHYKEIESPPFFFLTHRLCRIL